MLRRFVSRAYALWMRFAELLHRVTNPVVLAILFFGIVTPIGWVRRILGHSKLALSRRGEKQSFWHVASPRRAFIPEQLRRPF